MSDHVCRDPNLLGTAGVGQDAQHLYTEAEVRKLLAEQELKLVRSLQSLYVLPLTETSIAAVVNRLVRERERLARLDELNNLPLLCGPESVGATERTIPGTFLAKAYPVDGESLRKRVAELEQERP